MAGTGSITATSRAVGNNQYEVTVKFRIAFDYGGWNSGVPYTIWCDGQRASGTASFSVPSGGGSWVWADIATKTFTVTMPTSGKPKTISLSATINTGVTPPTINASNTLTLAARTWLWTVSYDANGGNGAPSVQTKSKGKTLTLSSTTPTRDGYTFVGWNTARDGSGATYGSGVEYTADVSVTLYAQWKINTYTVTYDANGGADAPLAQTKNYKQDLVLSDKKPIRKDYNFVGWGLSPDSTTVSYSPTDVYRNDSDITLYAIWIVAYIKPIVTNFKVDRSDLNGNLLEEGTNAKVTFDWKTDKTAIKAVVQSVPKVGTGALVKEFVLTGTAGNVSVVIGENGLSTDLDYDVSVMIYDAGGSETYSTQLPSLSYLIDFNEDGVSFGKPAMRKGVVDFEYPTRFEGGIDYIEIPKGADLNSYTKTGFYCCNINADAETIANMPLERVAFSLEVIKHAGIHQRLVTCPASGFNVYMRQHNNGVWGEWVKCVSSNMLGDYVVESGSNENGNYRKWSSGRLEMWGSVNVTMLNNYYIGAWSNYQCYALSLPFPVGSVSDVSWSMHVRSRAYSYISPQGSDATTHMMFWLCASSKQDSAKFMYHADGTWK